MLGSIWLLNLSDENIILEFEGIWQNNENQRRHRNF